MTEGPGSIFRPSDLQVPSRPPTTSPVFVAYLDGSSDAGLAGWGFAIVTGGDGINDTDGTCVTEAHGPVVTNPDHPAYLGAQAFTNNTADLTALGEIHYAISSHRLIHYRAAELSSIRPDRKLAAACAKGTIIPARTRELAAEERSNAQDRTLPV